MRIRLLLNRAARIYWRYVWQGSWEYQFYKGLSRSKWNEEAWNWVKEKVRCD